MELTHTINNQHMVKGLNRVMRLSWQNQGRCEQVLDKIQDRQLRQMLHELIKAHQQHIELLQDATRYLGGAPCQLSTGQLKMMPWPQHLAGFRIRRAERRLIDLCSQEIVFLTGGHEVTRQLNRVKDDITACLDMTSSEP
ncbi:hypothetical protein [Aliidiomarina maris]|uniref:DUF2383 domain-containing protein n=1 Tax=Aliidiomarina maris TaxID=531312 RepID=A0A327WVS8_9GAMM|nr:hypothetical protein [Aliidiomarina maris]MCL5050850.1 PA2169 family four-helix-bundle protein [Bacillota bacterium]RAJ96947.1 hypothetical protein B0I24_10610 [Aliidiomarina maris]RUO24558.1 hypothetical protein CWE07_07750 [Aliidiomarina maris]